MGWKAIARYVTGTSHQEQKIPCQDCGNYRIFKDVIVGAVADGAGSAKYSHFGSELAVETVIKCFADINELPDKQGFTQPLSEMEAKEVFTKFVKEVITALKKQADHKGYSVSDLACTLLVFIATPEWVAAMQIGDGFIVMGSQDGEYQMLFKPDKGEFFNETTFVTSANALEEMQVQVISGKQEFICASTDGLEKVAIRFSDWKPHAPFFKPLEEYLRETDKPGGNDDNYINVFLNSERLNSRTDDDKTLLLCLFE
ncbi:protein phosphatase 2C domain-containing protein [Sphaerospermopsis sp. LEGE 00249]|uniref:PP2C family serine/threonine-protein phosphatase n=1 Tax=Sphaerospermopsis sp. LEGE 00249 TaxID=1380707 RepID=UPI00164D6A23|nr:protein phosphatase 2C domain-containing protein [Sphaerospermopsis sp. LEGE 00249]